MAEQLVSKGYHVKASTTLESRLPKLKSIDVEPFIIDIGKLQSNIQTFLQTNVLVINIPSKNTYSFSILAKELEKSKVEKVVFVSSTSVYKNSNKIISESDSAESTEHPLLKIENLIRNIDSIQTTVVRFGGLIGYSRNPGKFFVKERVVHNSDSPVNLIHRDDCIEIICQIIEQEAWGNVFNCCADTHPTKKEFFTQAINSIGNEIPEFTKSKTKSFKIISNQKVKQFLNYEFLHSDLMKIKFKKTHDKRLKLTS